MLCEPAMGGKMAALSGCRILIVEDEAAIALDIEHALRAEGATVVGPAATIEDALAEIAQNQVDCALLDVKLGDGNADAVAAALDKRAIPIVFVTAYSDERMPPGFEARPVIRKPYEQRQLLNLVASIFKSA